LTGVLERVSGGLPARKRRSKPGGKSRGKIEEDGPNKKKKILALGFKKIDVDDRRKRPVGRKACYQRRREANLERESKTTQEKTEENRRNLTK